MGAAAIPIALALGSAGAGALGGAFAPLPYQQKIPYTGDVSAQNWMQGLHNDLGHFLGKASDSLDMQPTVTAPDMPGYQPHFAGATPQPGNVSTFSPPGSSGPTRRPTAFKMPGGPPGGAPASPGVQFPGGPPSIDPATGQPVNRDMHAARLALLALSGGQQGQQQGQQAA
jgi:hypothetical protein